MTEIKFKTVGIREILGKRIEFLNSAHILRIVKAHPKYLPKKFPKAKNLGVVVGRDNRIQSYFFTEKATMMLSKYKIMLTT